MPTLGYNRAPRLQIFNKTTFHGPAFAVQEHPWFETQKDDTQKTDEKRMGTGHSCIYGSEFGTLGYYLEDIGVFHFGLVRLGLVRFIFDILFVLVTFSCIEAAG